MLQKFVPLDSAVFLSTQIISFYGAYLMWYLYLCHNFGKGVCSCVESKQMNLWALEEQDL